MAVAIGLAASTMSEKNVRKRMLEIGPTPALVLESDDPRDDCKIASGQRTAAFPDLAGKALDRVYASTLLIVGRLDFGVIGSMQRRESDASHQRRTCVLTSALTWPGYKAGYYDEGRQNGNAESLPPPEARRSSGFESGRPCALWVALFLPGAGLAADLCRVRGRVVVEQHIGAHQSKQEQHRAC
jgi:hypothetical protein